MFSRLQGVQSIIRSSGLLASKLVPSATSIMKPMIITQTANFTLPVKKKTIIPVYTRPKEDYKKGFSAVDEINNQFFDKYDPDGWRRKLIYGKKSEVMKAGDAIKITLKSKVIFMGIAISIRKRLVDSNVLLRTKTSSIGVEMRYSVFNPNIDKIEIIQRPVKRPQRTRHYYIRGTKLDVSDTEEGHAKIERSRKRRLRRGGH